jgi:hypothetical protein
LRDLPLPPPAVQPYGLQGALTSGAKQVVVSTARDRVGIYAMATGRLERQVTVRFAEPSARRIYVIPWQIDPNGRMLLAGSDVGPPPAPPAAASATTRGAAPLISATGRDTRPSNQRLALLDVATGRLTAQVGIGADYATAVGWSHDRRTLAVGTYSGHLALYDARTLTRIKDAGTAHSGPIDSISFAADDATIVVGSIDGMDLWSVPDLVREGAPITTVSGSASWYAWFTNGDTVTGLAPLAGRPGQEIEGAFRFSAAPAKWAAQACALATRDMSRPEWHRYLGARPYQHVCPA